MLYFIICEDDTHMRLRVNLVIKELLEKNPIAYSKILEFDNFNDVVKFRKDTLKKDDHCIYLLDIEINGQKNGLDLAKKIRENDYQSEIIFLTSHVELSFSVFKYKLKVLEFIPKDYDVDERLFETFKVAIRLIEEKNQSDFITIKTRGKLHKIPFSQIQYIDAKNSNKKICLHTEDYDLDFYDTLKNISKTLDSRFIQCHRSYIVNTDKIEVINPDYKELYVILKNGIKVSVSRTHLKELREYVRI